MICQINTKIQVEPKGAFYYAVMGSEDHGKPSFILWTKIKPDEKGYIDLDNTIVKPVKSGNERAKNLIRNPNYTTFDIYIPCGYRGSSWFKILEAKDENIIETDYCYYHSPRGSLGVSVGSLVSVPKKLEKITIFWERDGRTYGEAKYGTVILNTKTRKAEEYPELTPEDLEDILS